MRQWHRRSYCTGCVFPYRKPFFESLKVRVSSIICPTGIMVLLGQMHIIWNFSKEFKFQVEDMKTTSSFYGRDFFVRIVAIFKQFHANKVPVPVPHTHTPSEFQPKFIGISFSPRYCRIVDALNSFLRHAVYKIHDPNHRIIKPNHWQRVNTKRTRKLHTIRK